MTPWKINLDDVPEEHQKWTWKTGSTSDFAAMSPLPWETPRKRRIRSTWN